MSDPATLTVTQADHEDVATLGRALALAFQDDPIFSWVVPDSTHRRRSLPSVFAAFADLYVPYGETYLAGDGWGAALWAPPGSGTFSRDQQETLGDSIAAVLGDDAERALELDAILEEHHPDRPAFYLQFMGVVPAQQRRGIGSALLRKVLDVCDATGTSAFLEATSPDNRRLYERHHFTTITQIDIPRGPSLWTMWRDPQAR